MKWVYVSTSVEFYIHEYVEIITEEKKKIAPMMLLQRGFP